MDWSGFVEGMDLTVFLGQHTAVYLRSYLVWKCHSAGIPSHHSRATALLGTSRQLRPSLAGIIVLLTDAVMTFAVALFSSPLDNQVRSPLNHGFLNAALPFPRVLDPSVCLLPLSTPWNCLLLC